MRTVQVVARTIRPASGPGTGTMVGVVSRPEFEELVSRAIDLVPGRFADALDELAIVVEQHAPPGMGSLYGLYQGVPRSHPEGVGMGHLPPRISIYMHPMVDHHPDPDELAEQVRITVLHEVGHHLGMNERQLEELGYG